MLLSVMKTQILTFSVKHTCFIKTPSLSVFRQLKDKWDCHLFFFCVKILISIILMFWYMLYIDKQFKEEKEWWWFILGPGIYINTQDGSYLGRGFDFMSTVKFIM